MQRKAENVARAATYPRGRKANESRRGQSVSGITWQPYYLGYRKGTMIR